MLVLEIVLLEGSSTLRSTIYVVIALALAMTAAGFAATAYHRERDLLGAKHFRAGEWALQHRSPDAIDQLRKALLFSPDEERYRLSLAEALVASNHLDEAESHLQQLADEDPSNGRINV